VVLQDGSQAEISKIVPQLAAPQTWTICSDALGTLLFDNCGNAVLQLQNSQAQSAEFFLLSLATALDEGKIGGP
jgi:hypothetical protein